MAEATEAQREAARRNILKAQAGARAKREQSKGSAPLPADAEEVLRIAVANTQGAGVLLAATVAPHLGTAIAGVPDDRGGWLVASRAAMAGELLRQRIKQEPRLILLLRRYNRLFEGSATLEIAGSLAVSAAIDSGRLGPDQEVEISLLGRQLAIKPATLLAGDVVAYVAAQQAQQESGHQAQQEQAAASPNGTAEPAKVGLEAT